ncbi:leukocyte elastase inhibitor-like [Paroedura picta]|uniref:leukocyte elastase inhibitor-like n=1 Tax=Paroedura picta TaxID=143630 RepID=UPI0040578B97
MEELAKEIERFAIDLFRRFVEANPTGNFIYCSLSISIALAILLLGARGNTAAELAKMLHFDGVKDLHSHLQKLNAKLKSDAPNTLKVANRLYGEKSCSFLQDFLMNIQNLYGTELSAVDFQNAASETRKHINQWVEEQTEGKILDLLSEVMVSEMTRLVLVNAVYFKGSWEEPFEVGMTKEMPFRLNEKEKKTVKMMYMFKKLPFRYIPERKLSVLKLPFKRNEFSMIVLLPEALEDRCSGLLCIGLQQLEKDLTVENLQEWTDPRKMSVSDVHVYFPKLKLQGTYDLKPYLSALGVLDVFDSSKADLSGMSRYPKLHLSKIVHTSLIEVNEGGTEAAGTTDTIPMLSSLSRETVLIFDHPFLLFLCNNETENILFIARVASP